MQWIKEAETAKPIDELLTSRSITGRTDSPDYDVLDAIIASALKRLLDKHIHFRKRVSVEEQRAQKYDRFLRGRQLAYTIYEHFRATGAHEAVQGLSDWFNIRLRNDDVQDFDTTWHQALLSASENPPEMFLEGFFKSELQDSVQFQTVLTMYEQENIRNNERPNDSRLKTPVRRHIDQTTVTKSHKGKKANAERRVAISGKQLDSVQKETHVVSVIPRLETDAIRDKKDNRLLLPQSEGTDWWENTIQRFW